MPLMPNATFGRYLRKLRDDRHVTLEAIALKTGLPTLFLLEMEEGRKPFPAGVFHDYPIAVGVPIRILMQEYLNAQLAQLCSEVGVAVERCELKIAMAH